MLPQKIQNKCLNLGNSTKNKIYLIGMFFSKEICYFFVTVGILIKYFIDFKFELITKTNYICEFY